MAKKKDFSRVDFSELSNASRSLLANIRFAGVDAPIKTIGVTSPGVDEGKSTTAISLAMTMAEGGKRTLLIDCDMRRRSLAKLLGIRAHEGVYSVLVGQSSLRDAIMPVPSVPNLRFLNCEGNIPNPPDVLSTKRFEALLRALAGKFDYVVVDMPPLGLFVDAAIVSSLLDGVVLCAREKKTRHDALDAAVDQLRQANANVLGTVLTFASRHTDDYYYYSYYNEENKRSKKSSAADAQDDFDNVYAANDVLESTYDGEWASSVGVALDAADASDRGRKAGQARKAAQAGTPARAQASGNADVFAPGAFKQQRARK